MKGRTAVVTGASRGIGRAVAAALASRGANVVINYAGNRQAAEETQALCAQAAAAGGYDAESLIVCADIADSDACSALIEAAVTKFGSVDILVNNAGITRDNLLMRMSESEFDDVIATNLRGIFLMMKAVSRQMMKQRYGRIINMASIVGVRGNSGQINYAASKAGVIGMTKSFAKEVAARGITVNAVAPGFIETDMTKALQKAAADAIMSGIPMKRMGRAEEVAEAAAFFASEAASYVTGQVLCVDGGM
ncbi:MAG: 3-oxoacyl-[acyl-carrier-protein] reductase [Emergencia sp.]|nr:3-oxoacyl-[acyl-carrier-protein] reductase [Emergencia sp.]